MILDVISIGIILCSVVMLSFLVGRRIKVVASINVDALPQEKQATVRRRLLRDRFDRKIVDFKKRMKGNLEAFGTIGYLFGKLWNRLYTLLVEIRKQGRKQASMPTETDRIEESVHLEGVDLLTQAQHALDGEGFDQAEQLYIEVIRKDPRSLEGYRGLSNLYIKKKDSVSARETLKYLWKLLLKQGNQNGLQSRVAFDLWEICSEADNKDEALAWIKQAMNQEPNNPKFLDAGIETYISLQDRLRAERVLEKLCATNPDNNKIHEFEQRIKDLSY